MYFWISDHEVPGTGRYLLEILFFRLSPAALLLARVELTRRRQREQGEAAV